MNMEQDEKFEARWAAFREQVAQARGDRRFIPTSSVYTPGTVRISPVKIADNYIYLFVESGNGRIYFTGGPEQIKELAAQCLAAVDEWNEQREPSADLPLGTATELNPQHPGHE